MTSESGLVKVGVSAVVEHRRKTLEMSSGVPVSTFATFGPFFNATHVESRVHLALEAYRAIGEWFRCSPSVALDAASAVAAEFNDVEPAPDDSNREAAATAMARSMAASFLQPATQMTDVAQELMSRLEQKQEAYEALLKEFEAACQLVEEYAQIARDSQHLARGYLDKVKAQEREIQRLNATV